MSKDKLHSANASSILFHTHGFKTDFRSYLRGSLNDRHASRRGGSAIVTIWKRMCVVTHVRWGTGVPRYVRDPVPRRSHAEIPTRPVCHSFQSRSIHIRSILMGLSRKTAKEPSIWPWHVAESGRRIALRVYGIQFNHRNKCWYPMYHTSSTNPAWYVIVKMQFSCLPSAIRGNQTRFSNLILSINLCQYVYCGINNN